MTRNYPVLFVDDPETAVLDIQNARDVELEVNQAIREDEESGAHQRAERRWRLLKLLREEAA
jgi:hypothetical protein